MKDFFLRRQMDADGWIPVELLASFRRVRIHTGSVNTRLIVDVRRFYVALLLLLTILYNIVLYLHSTKVRRH